MYYIKVTPDTMVEFWEVMAEMWNGTYVMNNPQDNALEYLGADEIWSVGTVTYREVA